MCTILALPSPGSPQFAPRFGDALTQFVGDAARRGIFTFRLGYATVAPASGPRRPRADVLT